MSLRPLPLLSTVARSLIQSRRAINTSSFRLQEPKAAHPDSHAEIRVSRGEPVADGAKEKEGPISGISKAREPAEGQCLFQDEPVKVAKC